MKKAIFAVFVLTFMTVFGNADVINEIKNEYWSWDNGTPQSLIFENYFFSEDGTFRYSWGRSGNSYSGGWYGGTYFYDAGKQRILFNVTGSATMGSSSKIGRAEPKELKIIELVGSDRVRIDYKAAHHKNTHHLFDGVMKIHAGRIKEQTWNITNYTAVREFYFDPQGNCFYKEGKPGADADAQYECEYNIIDDIILLQVESASVKNLSSKAYDNIKYDPPVKTYLRIGKEERGEIQVENSSFKGILGGSRDWTYEDGKYKVRNKLPALKDKDFYRYKIERQNAENISSLNDGQEITIY